MPGLKRKRENVSLFTHLVISSLSVGTATIVTHPIDMVKVWMQMEMKHNASNEAFSIPKFIRYFSKIYSINNNSITPFFSGIGAALIRSILYGGLRIGLYEPINTKVNNTTLSSTFAGGMASLVGNPLSIIYVNNFYIGGNA